MRRIISSSILFCIIFFPFVILSETCPPECEATYITCSNAALDETEEAACDAAYTACCAGFDCCSCYEDMTEEEMVASDDCAQCSSDGFDFNICDISDEDLEAATTESDQPDEETWVLSPDVPYKLETPIGAKTYVDNLSDYISTVYNFALSIVGILAVVVIIYGGMRWASAAGNDSAITSAKETIIGALIGLIIAVGSYTILNFINPQLVSLKGANIMKIPADIGSTSVDAACEWKVGSPSGYEGMHDAEDSKCSEADEPYGADDDSSGTSDLILTYSCYCTSIDELAKKYVAEGNALNGQHCWDWVNKVYASAGASWGTTLYTFNEPGCLTGKGSLDVSKIEPGDWLYIHNGTNLGTGTGGVQCGNHSVIFLEWVDAGKTQLKAAGLPTPAAKNGKPNIVTYDLTAMPIYNHTKPSYK